MAFRYKQRPGCKFTGCENMPSLGMGGYCYLHEKSDPGYERKQKRAAEKNDQKKLSMLTHSNKPSDLLSENSVKNEGLKYIIELRDFFKEAAMEIDKNPYCWECSSRIFPIDYRNSTAHILFKEHFRSVATHPLSYVVAGAKCGCHHRTHRLDTFSQMKIFPIAVSRFRQFEHLIKEKHKLLSEFKNYADLYEKNDNNIYVPGDSL